MMTLDFREPQRLRIAGLDADQAVQVRAEVAERFQQAALHYAVGFCVCPVRFDLSGGTAGMHCVRGSSSWLRFNPWLFARYWEDSLRNTVAHEVAHAVVWQRFPRRRLRPHGAEWRSVMALFDADDRVTCNYDLSDVPQRRQQRFAYWCGCREHAVSAVRHNRMERGQGSYHCRYCRERLRPSKPLAQAPRGAQ